GAYAGNITSDNITPLHLMNIKRLAYERPRTAAEAPGDLRSRVAAFVDSRVPASTAPPAAAAPARAATGELLDFVCEDDVRRALREGRVLRLSARAIVTPSARDAAAGKDVLAISE